MEENQIGIRIYSGSTYGALVKVCAQYPVDSDLTIEARSIGDNNATSHTFYISQGGTSDEWADTRWVSAEWQIVSISPEEDKLYRYVVGDGCAEE